MKRIMTGAMLALLAGCTMQQGNQRATLYVSMTGIQETPGPGDPDGNGTVEIRVTPGTGSLCWNLYARAIEPATRLGIFTLAIDSVSSCIKLIIHAMGFKSVHSTTMRAVMPRTRCSR